MSLKEKYNSTIDMLSEGLKFTFYGKKEAELETLNDTSQISTEKEMESPYISYNPFQSQSLNSYGQQDQSTNKNESIMRWRQSAYLPEVEQAVSEVANEAIVYDEIEETIKLNLSDIELPDMIKDKMVESFEKILYLLDFNEKGDDLFKQWYVDGELNVESVFDNERIRDGIKKLILLTPFNFNTAITPTGEKKYYYGDSVKDTKKVYSDEQITHINSGIPSLDKKFHLSYLNLAMKSINQLNLMEESLVIARITKSTEKRAFYIPTKGLNKYKAEEFMQSIMNKYRQKKIYNSDSGTVENRSRSISVLEDFWFPVDASGNGPKIENIAGTAPGFTSFEDVDYLVNKVYRSLKVPISRRAPDQRMSLNNQVDIEKDELKFFKFVLKLRRRFNNLFVDLLKKEVLARKLMNVEDWIKIQEKIKFSYANSNEYSEIKNNQILDMRIGTANNADSLVGNGYLSKVYVQECILRLTDEEIKQIDQQNAIAGASKEEDEFGNDVQNSEFKDDYDVSRRGSSPPRGGSFSEMGEPPTPDKKLETKPTSPEGVAAESKSINDTMLSILQEGDIITNGTDKMKFEKGKLILI